MLRLGVVHVRSKFRRRFKTAKQMVLLRAVATAVGLQETALKVTRGHLIAGGIVSLLLAITVGAVGMFAKDGGPKRITASISNLGPVDLSLSAAPGQATSPVCGCFKIHHRKDWRGITFASRTAEISRSIHGRASTYAIFASNPEPASWEPGSLYFPSELLAFEHPGYGIGQPPFDPEPIKDGGVPKGWKLVKREALGFQPYFFLTTHQPVFVSMLGPTPIGAWIPSKGGKVHLGFRKGLTANAQLQGELVEEDPAVRFGGRLSHPLADFLGPDVVIWSRDYTAGLDSDSREVFSRGFKRKRNVVLALYIRRPPFATRVAALPLTLPLRLTGEHMIVLSEHKTSGPYRLSLTGRPVTAREYQRMQAKFKSEDVIFLHHLTGWFPTTERWNGEPYEVTGCHEGLCYVEDYEERVQSNQSMKFRYPPRPPTAQGFTVFGPLRSLHMSEAKGAVSSLPHPIGAPSDLRLHDVELLGSDVEDSMPVPANDRSYELDLSASAVGKINGENLVEQESMREAVSFGLFVVTGLASLVAVFFAALAYLNRKGA